MQPQSKKRVVSAVMNHHYPAQSIDVHDAGSHAHNQTQMVSSHPNQ